MLWDPCGSWEHWSFVASDTSVKLLAVGGTCFKVELRTKGCRSCLVAYSLGV